MNRDFEGGGINSICDRCAFSSAVCSAFACCEACVGIDGIDGKA
jgi:hypothetical protein